MCCRKLQAWSRRWKLLFLLRTIPALCILSWGKQSFLCSSQWGKFTWSYLLSNFIRKKKKKKQSEPGKTFCLIKAIWAWWELNDSLQKWAHVSFSWCKQGYASLSKSVSALCPSPSSPKPTLLSPSPSWKAASMSCCLFCLASHKNWGFSLIPPCCGSVSSQRGRLSVVGPRPFLRL